MNPAVRRRVLALLGGLAAGRVARAAPDGAASRAPAPSPAPMSVPRPAAPATSPAPLGVRRGRVLRFPGDHGAHPDTRIEWWYATGALQAEGGGRPLGFQITFFRSATGLAADLPGRFAPRQLLFGHAAVTDVARATHRHDERLARWSGVPGDSTLASAALRDTAVRLGDWRFERAGPPDASVYTARLGRAGRDALALDLRLAATQPLLLQGEAGWSRKGPEPVQASHYYSAPQLAVTGTVGLGSERLAVRGTGWLDHEWSDELMPRDAVGWDWVGLNGDDGSALTAFRLRRRDGGAVWAGGSHRPKGGALRIFGPDEVQFEPLAEWRSPKTGGRYPVRWRLRTPAGVHEVQALLDAQELDSRASTGAIYWEGLSDWRDADGRALGRGYLEMTGYVEPLRLG